MATGVRQYGAPKDDPRDPKSRERGPGHRKDPEPKQKDPDPSPQADVVNKFHKYAPVDTRKDDIHHTIGLSPTQAASGAHNHRDGQSVLLFEGMTLTGSRTSLASVWPSLAALLTAFGARDQTTP